MNQLLIGRRAGLVLASLLLAGASWAAPGPYNEAADGAADLAKAQASAKAAGKPLVVVFGANWCADCVALDRALHASPSQALMAQSFEVVKIDVGTPGKNAEITKRFGEPTKNGIPAAVVVAPDGKVLYATKAGELANARHMSEQGIYDFFKDVRDGKLKSDN